MAQYHGLGETIHLVYPSKTLSRLKYHEIVQHIQSLLHSWPLDHLLLSIYFKITILNLLQSFLRSRYRFLLEKQSKTLVILRFPNKLS